MTWGKIDLESLRLSASSFSAMNSFEWNKIAGAVLFALLLAVAGRNLAQVAIQPQPANPQAFPIEVTQASAPAAAKVEVDIATLLQTASVQAGQRSAKKCIACHSFDEGGAHKIGPALWGVVGRKIGTQSDFNYSRAMKEHGDSWTIEVLDGYLRSPRQYIKGTNMAFIGLRKDQERANVIAYLRSLQ